MCRANRARCATSPWEVFTLGAPAESRARVRWRPGPVRVKAVLAGRIVCTASSTARSSNATSGIRARIASWSGRLDNISPPSEVILAKTSGVTSPRMSTVAKPLSVMTAAGSVGSFTALRSAVLGRSEGVGSLSAVSRARRSAEAIFCCASVRGVSAASSCSIC